MNYDPARYLSRQANIKHPSQILDVRKLTLGMNIAVCEVPAKTPHEVRLRHAVNFSKASRTLGMPGVVAGLIEGWQQSGTHGVKPLWSGIIASFRHLEDDSIVEVSEVCTSSVEEDIPIAMLQGAFDDHTTAPATEQMHGAHSLGLVPVEGFIVPSLSGRWLPFVVIDMLHLQQYNRWGAVKI